MRANAKSKYDRGNHIKFDDNDGYDTLRSSPLYIPPNTTIQMTEATTTQVPSTSLRVIFVLTSNLAKMKLKINATLPRGATHYTKRKKKIKGYLKIK